MLGASSWRVDEITPDRVLVTPAPGRTGQAAVLAWRHGRTGRSSWVARWAGSCASSRPTCARRTRREAALARLREEHDLDALAAQNLLAYLEDEREAPARCPTDRRIVVERFRDELGDWRVCVLTPFGAASTRRGRSRSRRGSVSASGARSRRSGPTTGSRVRLPEGDADAASEAMLFPDADEVEDLVVAQVANSALFASRFRENAARALLLPRRRPGTRTPLWQQRQRAADLLAVASRAMARFPILVETYRECLSDVFDLPALREVLAGIERREIAIHSVETTRAPRRSRARCSSTTSRRTCTRATRPLRNGVPRR